MAAKPLSIMGGLVFDGVSPEPSRHPVHTEGGVITGLEGPPPRGAEVIEADGRFVSPGFLDLHFHAYAVSMDARELEGLPLSYVTAKAAQRLKNALGRGFTTVRDVAGGDIGLQMAIDQGLIPGPRYLFSGPALSQTGGHGDMRPGHLSGGELCSHICQVVDGVDPLRAVVRDRFRTGAHVIKLFTSGGVFSPTDPLRNPQYSPRRGPRRHLRGRRPGLLRGSPRLLARGHHPLGRQRGPHHRARKPPRRGVRRADGRTQRLPDPHHRVL